MPIRLAIATILFSTLPFSTTTLAHAAQPAKIVLLAGIPSHGPGEHEFNAGITLLEKMLRQNDGVKTVVVRGGWPDDEHVFQGASALVFYMDGGPKHPVVQGDHLAAIGKLMAAGVGLVCLHYAVEVPAENGGKEFLDWLGGYYETGYSHNPVNDVKLTQASPDHPISRGWKSFETRDEWYYSIRFKPNDNSVTPILTAMLPPSNPTLQIVAWAKERADGGRGFACTGAHYHRNWGDADFRRMIVNGIFWTAKIKIPKNGARVELTSEDLTRGQDSKPAPK
jgi:type 1 glutamine amidotransferase